MSKSRVGLYNAALINLGVTSLIADLPSTDRNAIILNSFYDLALEQTLKDFDWNFASTYRDLSLTQSGESVIPKYIYEYDYPNDCLSARQIVIASDDVVKFEVSSNYKTGQKVINTNQQFAILRYTRRISDENLLDSEFIVALSWYLAFLAGATITGGTEKGKYAYYMYSSLIKNAQVTNATEGCEDDDQEIGTWLESRT